MTFADYNSALRMRETIRQMVRTEMEAQRPKYRYALVESINMETRRALVRFIGDDIAVEVNLGSVIPARPGQIVRVDGISSDRFVTDVLGDSVNTTRLDLNTRMSNSRLMASGGGNKIVTSTVDTPPSSVKWSQRFMIMAGGRSEIDWSSSGFFEVNMPADGTVIHGYGGVADTTVSGGYITLPPLWGVLWYELPVGKDQYTLSNNFYATQYDASTDIEIPNTWVPIVALNMDSNAIRSKWITGEQIDVWRTPTYLGGWVDYSGGWPPARFRRLPTGEVELRGLIKQGTTPDLLQMPVGFRPLGSAGFAVPCNGSGVGSLVMRVDIGIDGVLKLDPGYPFPTGGFVFLDGIRYQAEQ